MTALGHVIRLCPTEQQANAFARAAGCARWTYNWGLEEYTRQYRAGEKPTIAKIKKQFNASKETLCPWIYESPKDANQQAFADLKTGLNNFFASCQGTRKGPKMGYPVKHKKGRNDSFYVSNDKFRFAENGQKKVYLPRIGWVKTREKLRFDGKIMSARVKRGADHWTISVNVECGEYRRDATHENTATGVDIGSRNATSDAQGRQTKAPKPLKEALKKLRRANRKLHRRQKSSANRYKARMELARVHLRIGNIRKDFWHKETARLCRENQTITIESLNVLGMLRNGKMARTLSDLALGEFARQMKYKAPLHGTTLILADRFYPSSKRCSCCGNIKKDLGRGDYMYHCLLCGLKIDRDLNAALNLLQYPRLVKGNWDGQVPVSTPNGDLTSTPATHGGASRVVEVGTSVNRPRS